MGKVKKGHNWKARQNEVEYQKQTQVKVEVDIDVQEDKYDESNVFALPSEKQKAKKIKNSTVPKQKPLSKKEKKRLKQVKQRKAIGQTRKQLYEDLLKVQATSKELSEMTSVSEAQTMGVKRLTSNGTKSSKVTDIKVTKNMPASSIARRKINSIKGSNKLHAKKNKDKSSAHIRETSSSASSDSDEEVNELPPSTNKANILSGEKFSDPNTVISHDVLPTYAAGAVNSNMQAEPVQNGNMTVQHKEEAEMDVDLDVCQDKCDETSTKVHSSKKKIKNIKSESIAQANLSKQEEKTEKQFKQKLTKGEKRKQFNDNLEESQFVKEESDITTSVLEGSQLNSMLEENREESVSKKESDVMTSLSEDQDTKRLKSIVQTPKMPAKHVPVLRTEEIEMKRINWMDMEASLHSRGKPSWEFSALLKMIRLEQAERRAIRKDIDFILHLLRTACPNCINKEKHDAILQRLEAGCSTCITRENQDSILHSVGTAVLKHNETRESPVNRNMIGNQYKKKYWKGPKQISCRSEKVQWNNPRQTYYAKKRSRCSL